MFIRKLITQRRRHRGRRVSLPAALLVALALLGAAHLVAAAQAGAFIASGWEEEWGEGSDGGGGWGEGSGWQEGSWEEDLPSQAEEEEKQLADEENEAIEAFEEREEQERAEREEKEQADREARRVEEKTRLDEEEPERVFEEERRTVEAMPALCERLVEEGTEAALAGNGKLWNLRAVEAASCETTLAIEWTRLGLPANTLSGATPILPGPVGSGGSPPTVPSVAPRPPGGYGPIPRLKVPTTPSVGPLGAPRSVSQSGTARAIAPTPAHARHARRRRRLSPSSRR